MTGLPLTLRRWTRHEYERSWTSVCSSAIRVYRDPVPDASAPYGWRYRSVRILTPPAAIAPLAMTSTPLPVAKLLP